MTNFNYNFVTNSNPRIIRMNGEMEHMSTFITEDVIRSKTSSTHNDSEYEEPIILINCKKTNPSLLIIVTKLKKSFNI